MPIKHYPEHQIPSNITLSDQSSYQDDLLRLQAGYCTENYEQACKLEMDLDCLQCDRFRDRILAK